MTNLCIAHEGVLFRNPEPGIRALCAYLPNVVPISDDELLCFFRLGQAFYSLDGRVGQIRSTDGGSTWSDETAAALAPVLDPAFTYTAPHGSRLRDGTLLLLVQRHLADDVEAVRFNPTTGGMRPMEITLFTSADVGRTWSGPTTIDVGPGPVDAPSAVLE